jgi:predicted RecA/RadA family phage recombinase
MSATATPTKTESVNPVNEAFKNVLDSAERIKNDELAVIPTVSLGDVVRQGDVYLVAITDITAGSSPATGAQLAPGNTQGARHIMEGNFSLHTVKADLVIEEIKKHVPTFDSHPALIGPVVKSLAGGCTLTHPEHGNRELPANETFAVTYQRALAEEVRRQQD